MPLPPLRPVIARSIGERHGPINRLIRPDDLIARLKPFIFLHYFNAEIEPGFGFGGEEALSFASQRTTFAILNRVPDGPHGAQHRYAVSETSEAVTDPPTRRPLACI